MFLPFPAMMVASVVLVAQSMPPRFDVDPSCQAAAGQSRQSDSATICHNTEQKARQEIVKRWSQVSAADKAKCVPLSTLGGTPTYTELLTCLELTREAKKLRDQKPLPPLPEAKTSEPATTGLSVE